jgi:hypothetical protein
MSDKTFFWELELMMRWIVIGLVVFFATGCASRWEHSTKLQSDFYADDRVCQADSGGASRGIERNQLRVSYESCMWQKGWRKKQKIWFFDPSDQ